ncbi:MAG: BamA/TamA family outer membrane protein [Fibrobacteres bacterium]|nr:BamA/TamA family outer membrane protein [Fibrobacterota bacterium]
MFVHFLLLALRAAAGSPDSCQNEPERSFPKGFAALRLEGLRATRPEVVRSEIKSRPCTEFPVVDEDIRRLKALGIFASVETRMAQDTLVFSFRELPTFLPVPNGRLSDEEGLSLGAGLKSPNLLGRAIAGEFLFLVGNSLEYQASITASRFGSLALGWEAMAGRTERWDDGRGYQELSHAGFVRLWGPTDRFLRLLGEAKVVDVRSDRDGICLSGRQDLIPSLRGGTVFDGRDDPSNTASGIYQELTLEKSGNPFGGPVDAWQVLSDTRLWVPLGARWGVHLANLFENREGRMDRWQTYVVGGANSARGLPGAWAVAPSEDLGTMEVRWTLMPVKPVLVVGQNLYVGLQAVGGVDVASAWGEAPLEAQYGLFTGLDAIVPFVERLRTNLTWSPAQGAGFAFSFGMFEKTQAQRFRVR